MPETQARIETKLLLPWSNYSNQGTAGQHGPHLQVSELDVCSNLTWIFLQTADVSKVWTLTQIILAKRSRWFKPKRHLFTLPEEVSEETKQDKQKHPPPSPSETHNVQLRFLFPFFWPALHVVPHADTAGFTWWDPFWQHLCNTVLEAMLWGAQ